MWIFDALMDVPVKKPFLLLWFTLGAAHLLLQYFGLPPLNSPVNFSVISAVTFILWQPRRPALAAIVTAINWTAAWLMLPAYTLAFCLLVAFLLGKLAFPELFRLWKWIAVTLLLWITFPILSSWSGITQLTGGLPYGMTGIIQTGVLAFCILFALLPYQIRKDSVREAFEYYPWKTNSDAFRLAAETVELYKKVKDLMKEHEQNPRIVQDLEDYTQRIIHQCFRMHQISTEISNSNIGSLEQQILHLKQKLESVEDSAAKEQYGQALENKQKQIEQLEKLQCQQERLLAQIVNYNSSLENIRLAYSHQDFQKTSGRTENIEVFMEGMKARAEV